MSSLPPDTSNTRPAWHALLAPIPSDVRPLREPLAPPEILATEAGASIARWSRLRVELSAAPRGLRSILVVLDESGTPIAANDTVLYRTELSSAPAEPLIEYVIESIGGRLEPTGEFRGTRWRSVSRDHGDENESLEQMSSTPSAPTDDETNTLRALVAELIRRA